jgi:hypothetical protein
VLTYKESWGYESGACGQANFRNMLRLLILNSERLSEAIPDPTGIDTLSLNSWAEKIATKKTKKCGGLGSLGGTWGGWPVIQPKQGSEGSSMAREQNV